MMIALAPLLASANHAYSRAGAMVLAQAAPAEQVPAAPSAAAPVKPRPVKPPSPTGASRPAPTQASTANSHGIAVPAVDPASLSQPQNPEPVLHAARAGLGPCLPAVERGAAAVIDAPHNAYSIWYPGAPSLHAFLSVAVAANSSTAAPRAASILLATPSATGCDASTLQVFPTARSCADVEQDFLKSGTSVARIAGLPVFKGNGGDHRLLMPTAGNGCVIIGIAVQYVAAAPPPPPSIVAPKPATPPQAVPPQK